MFTLIAFVCLTMKMSAISVVNMRAHLGLCVDNYVFGSVWCSLGTEAYVFRLKVATAIKQINVVYIL